jgi:lipoyl(octanoyl) transferase
VTRTGHSPQEGLVLERWGRVEYREALQRQEDVALALESGTAPETVVLVEHDAVYTIGRTPDQTSLAEVSQLPAPVVEISRGGQATWHGPGQLVVYPILDLNKRGRDLHRHLRDLESVVIDTCRCLGITAGRREGLTGVWVEDRKIASVGVGVRRWITRHGVALNVDEDLRGFLPIIPCGIQGVTMTSLNKECNRTYSVWDVASVMEPILEKTFRLS